MEILQPIDNTSESPFTPALQAWCETTETILEQLPSPVGPTRDELYIQLAKQIGNTPTNAAVLPAIYTKYESANLSGSHYDRAYLATFEALEADGLIFPGVEVRDISSGSAANSLAIIAKALGYQARITVPSELPAARLYPARHFGAKILDIGPGYIPAASNFQAHEMKALIRDRDWRRLRSTDRTLSAVVFEHQTGERVCYLNHSENLASPRAFQQIGRELVSQVAEPPKSLALAIGNWTTIAGISPVIRQVWPNTTLIGYQSPADEKIENYGTVSEAASATDVPVRFRDKGLVDEIRTVSAAARDEMAARINRSLPVAEQLGRSSLMGLVVAEQAIQQRGGSAITIAYDQAMRY